MLRLVFSPLLMSSRQELNETAYHIAGLLGKPLTPQPLLGLGGLNALALRRALSSFSIFVWGYSVCITNVNFFTGAAAIFSQI
ncbi:hypothetical protein [Paraburkholderia rhynchosiae]|uniref:hypothetical protein n=1 Tax=Paraburkholderia rhynchosiae TaxID=487049 RepID=UPI0011AED0A3|nr:hypothetical protein [Paraburkholderia rhynchosiae]